MRVLHVVENLDGQAVESWLLRMLRAGRDAYPHVHWTFFCVLPRRGRLDDSARALGAQVLHSPHEIGRKARFLASLRGRISTGRFDVLHCHHDVMSGAYLLASTGLALRRRVVHVHNTSLSIPTPRGLKAAAARALLRQACLRMADTVVGVSRPALESLVGPKPRPTDRVIHCAIDTERFRTDAADAMRLRRDLRLDAAARILLFVGRMIAFKNPAFVLEVLAQMREERAVALFAGAGDQEEVVRARAQRMGLGHRVHVLGRRDDVPRLMAAADVMLWPGLETPQEGLGLGVVEAQAAGLPVVMSLGVPDEAVVMRELVVRVPLAAGAAAWARAVHARLGAPRLDRHRCWARVAASSFATQAGLANLMSLYE